MFYRKKRRIFRINDMSYIEWSEDTEEDCTDAFL